MEAGPGEAVPGEHGGASPLSRRPAPLYKRLPRGPHRLGRRAVAQNQRVRIHGAMVQAVADVGYEAVSIRLLIALAGVSRRSFYEQFTDKQECFLETFDLLVREQVRLSRAACAHTSGGSERKLAAALARTAAIASGDRAAASLVLVDAQALGAPGVLRMRAAGAAWERLLRARLAGTALAPAPAGTSAAVTLGGLQGILAARLHEPGPLPRDLLAEQLGWWALAPKAPVSGPLARRLARLLRQGSRRVAATAGPRSAAGGTRELLLACALRLAARHPVAVLSAAQIADEAGVPLESFFELFADRDDCIATALERAGEELLSIAAPAAVAGEDWAGALRATLGELLEHLAAHPLQTRALVVLAPCAGAESRRRALRVERELAAALNAHVPDRAELAGEALVGAIYHLLRCHLADRRLAALPGAGEHLALFALAPVLGAEQAARVLLEGD
ncbi:MAG TPA: TetR/AcrR family transcriptional regulator [Solirubrobacteraceae bacterium]|jgi:AcrR family transcriptional regulator|nr:TetR/AcrR family transcriptional regulator [Solirubrobacteraceae bacterium]